MKQLLKLFLFANIAIMLFTACDKVDSLPYYPSGTESGIGVVYFRDELLGAAFAAARAVTLAGALAGVPAVALAGAVADALTATVPATLGIAFAAALGCAGVATNVVAGCAYWTGSSAVFPFKTAEE